MMPLLVLLVKFLLKLNSHHTCAFTSPLQQTLKQNHISQLLQCYKYVETLSILMVFKPIIAWNRMLKGHVNLVICLRSIYYTFFKILFCNIFIEKIPTA